MNVPIIDLNDARFRDDKYAYIEELRALGDHARLEDGSVVFFNQADAVEVFRCHDFRFAFNLIDESRSPYLANAIRHELLNMHGAAHDRLSRLVKQALRDRIVEGMRETITGIVDDLIDAMPRDGEVEFCAEFADPLPARVLGPMFGVPYETTEGLSEWIKVGGRKLDALQTGVGIENVEEANRKIHDYLRTLLDARRNAPGDDLFSELMRAEIDGDRMSADELVYLSAELASAGVDTTRTQLPLIVHLLLQSPAELAKLRNDPGLALRAVDEGMRFAPLPWLIPHAATQDLNYRGIAFETGQLAYVMVPAANRDPAMIDRPQEFDITRDRARHFAFGHGMHACPGAQLARMEMSIALQALVQRLDKIDLLGDVAWEPGHEGRGAKALNLAVHKA